MEENGFKVKSCQFWSPKVQKCNFRGERKLAGFDCAQCLKPSLLARLASPLNSHAVRRKNSPEKGHAADPEKVGRRA